MPLAPRFLVVLTLAGLVFFSGTPAIAAPLTISQLLDIRHPNQPVWSPNGRRIAYLWDRCDVVNLYVVESDGKSLPRALTQLTDGKVTDQFWSDDGRSLYFFQNGKLWNVNADGGTAAKVWAPRGGASSVTPSPDRTRVAAIVAGEDGGHMLVVRTLATGTNQPIAHNNGLIYSVRWSPDGQRLAFVGDGKIIPHDVSPAYSGAKLVYRDPEFVPGRLYVVSIAGGEPVALGSNESRYEGISWAGNGRLTYERQAEDFKDRRIVIADIRDGQEHVIHTDHDAQFWSLPEGEAGGEPLPSPDGKWIAYVSDAADDWDHLYIVAADGGDAIQITSGHAEAWRPAWSHDSHSLAFDTNDSDHPGDRRIGIATISADNSRPAVRYVTKLDGTNTEPVWSPEDTSIVYQHTDWQNSADLYTMLSSGTAPAARLTDSMPRELDKSLLVKPKYVIFPGADGTPVPGWLFLPRHLDKTKRHAAIVWIHGDGINQNYDGWHIQRNYAVYYSLHQYWLQHGYVVFAPDYRGSIGYGAKWRSAVYMDVGGKDAEDASRAGEYLKTLPYVDGNRIGVWGLSYGGFFTLIAVTRHPLLFRSAVDVAGVVDYAMYYDDPYHGSWTASRIGTPEQNPRVYANASPISHINELQRPLLILHGTADVNVPFIESVRLIDEALKAKKGDLITFMMYPGEFHYFSREQVLGDAWRRVDEFFAKTLSPAKQP
ncbi:MAG TPA: S9 family peptidase [Acidobacteriaceae bacterium]|jgi:dipeptidyl aminopeptidase/acylaminoacyl peptidase